MRKKIVAGNWKMNTTREEAFALASEIAAMVADRKHSSAEVILAPPFPFLAGIAQLVEKSGIHVAAQNCSEHRAGAFTGEVSAPMLKSAGVNYVIAGHSERRTLFHESDAQIAGKVRMALDNKLMPVLCVGETFQERESGVQERVILNQLLESLFNTVSNGPEQVVIAYEPVWAIGTGKTASPEQAQEIHRFIRNSLADRYGAAAAEEVTILYGGSCNDQNARDLFSMPDIDGGLIGGASLRSDTFLKIINSF